MSSEPQPVAAERVVPSGTVTFVFTDIEGSTQRWERNRAAMEEAAKRHDAIVRDALLEGGGHIFKTVGDGFCAAFGRPETAVAAVLAAQRALAAADFSSVGGLRVRAALHTGTAEERGGDYFGPTVNRVARLLAIGHGGQILVSGVTADLVLADLPAEASLRDLGEHRLKDLARPEWVYQLLAPDLEADYPPLRSLDALPNNLPAVLTSFVGREHEIDEITALLATHRLVTLTGSGGLGKTRTSLQVAANLLDGSGDGVWFIELAPLSDEALIPSAVAAALGSTLPAIGDPLAMLVAYLKTKTMLIVFDNCEHLVGGAARVIGAILQSCPKVNILASSRQGLGIAGETAYRMPTLAVPSTSLAGAAEVGGYPALALFADRARAVDHHFTLTHENTDIVADICRRLDGIPLAIELAAARVKILSPHQLRERLDERFRVLTGGSRDALPRQQTLRALIDWSYDLLDERERKLFRRLSIFVDGFTLEAAGAVCSDAEFDELDVFDALASVVDKSLVLAEPAGNSHRYRLLESTRVYAREKLAAADEHALLADRHLRYFHARMTEAAAEHEETGSRAMLNSVIASELGNVRAALDLASTGAEVLLGCDIVWAVRGAWARLGIEAEGLVRTTAFLKRLGDARTAARARMLLASLRVTTMIAGYGAALREPLELVLEIAREVNDNSTLADALQLYVWILTSQGGSAADARRALDEAEAIPDMPKSLWLALSNARAFFSLANGEPEIALRTYEQLLAEHRAVGNPAGVRMTLGNIAEAAHMAGDTNRSITVITDVIATYPLSQTERAQAMSNLAGYFNAVGDCAQAKIVAREALRSRSALGAEGMYELYATGHLALALALEGDVERAAVLAGYVEIALARQGFMREYTERRSHDHLLRLLNERLSPADLAVLTQRGALLSREAAVVLALAEP